MVKCAFKGCKKKIKLQEQEIICKCGKCFCKLHRFQEAHDCEHMKDKDDEKEKELLISNMKCEFKKIISI